MTYSELERVLKKAGWAISHGKAHNQATHPNRPGVKISIPRHKGDIPKGTLAQIKSDAGLI